ncbi:MAG: hypothetical protein M1827_002437 [Pycnora praestabilis]|nr:MAG: hypothetical protein M1827_002437 [Pycnora praestabilis]
MANQDDAGIALSSSINQRSFRLLELPPTLLEVLSSETLPTMSIKSAAPIVGSEAPSYAVLCTHDQTFQLRQVHSSNSIFLVQPSSTKGSAEDDRIPLPSVSIVAACKATLELHEVSTIAAFHLRKLLPVYNELQDGQNDSEMMASTWSAEKRTSKAEVFTNVPLSDQECEGGWIDLCAFEVAYQAMRPSARTLAKVWTALLAAATLHGVDLTSQFSVNNMWGLMADDGFPRSLVEAIFHVLRMDSDPPLGHWASLKRSKCVWWVGCIILESSQNSGFGTPQMDFLRRWKDVLPELWRGDAVLDALKGMYTEPTRTTIAFKDAGFATLGNDGMPAQISDSAKKGTLGARKWHEKFKDARR